MATYRHPEGGRLMEVQLYSLFSNKPNWYKKHFASQTFLFFLVPPNHPGFLTFFFSTLCGALLSVCPFPDSSNGISPGGSYAVLFCSISILLSYFKGKNPLISVNVFSSKLQTGETVKKENVLLNITNIAPKIFSLFYFLLLLVVSMSLS